MTKEQFLTTIYKNEDQFTAATYRFINLNFPELRHFYFHVPNENQHRLVSLGVLAGVPDFIFIKPSLLFLELKMPNGTLSPKQKALHQLWASNGIKITVAYNPAQVIDFLLTLAI